MGKDNSKPQRERRRREAEARMEAYDFRSPQEQLERLGTPGFRAVKERARLHRLLSTGMER